MSEITLRPAEVQRSAAAGYGRWMLALAAIPALSGCFFFNRLSPDCHKPQEYQRAGEVAPLIVPSGLDPPNTQGALVVPKVTNSPPLPGPKDTCLDIPPKYKAAPANKAGTASS